MKSIPVGSGTAPSIALGLMRIDGMPDDAVRALVKSARDVGIDFFDFSYEHIVSFALQVVLGTTTAQRVTDAAQGSDIPLTRPE